MSGEMDAAGALTTAGLAAGALEGREARGPGDGLCLNCGAQLSGPYCAQCGQAAHAHRTLGHVLGEFLQGLWHFDTKVWRTLPMLVGRPGTLTRNYVYGKRARYVSPLALFLLTIFAMFFAFALVPTEVARVGTEEELAEARREIVRVTQERGVEPPAGLDSEPSGTWQERVTEAANNGEIRVNTGFPDLDQRIRNSLQNPDLVLYKMQEAASTFSFLLVPISLPFMWLLFVWKRGVTLYDHVVFTLYALCFASIAFMVIALLGRVPVLEVLGAAILFLGMPAHMFFHLKGAYALGWWSATWRTFLLLIFAVISLSIYLVAIVLLGLAG